MRLRFPERRAQARGAIVNGLSVDVEDWFQVGAFEDVIERDQWASLADRVDRNVREILGLFDEVEAKGTFFTLGWVAQRHGALLREVAARGHEIASHGWVHRRVFTMDRTSFAEDIRKARQFAAGFDHIVSGWIFFALVMIAVLGASWRFFDRSPDDPLIDAAALEGSPLLARLAPVRDLP